MLIKIVLQSDWINQASRDSVGREAIDYYPRLRLGQ